MSSEILGRTFAIGKEFDAASFDCGVPALNEYLKKHALHNHANLSAKTFVALREHRVVGYYSLTVASVERDEPPERVTKGLARHPVPLLLIAKLAVDQTEQGRGLGKMLLKDALQRIVRGTEDFGCRAVVVHAKDDQARAFYEKCGFVPSPIEPLHLYLLLKDIRALVSSSKLKNA